MQELSLTEARADLTEIVNRAQYQGETTVITRHRKAAAMIVPATEPTTLGNLIAAAATGTATLGDISIPLDAAAALYTAVTDDRVALNLKDPVKGLVVGSENMPVHIEHDDDTDTDHGVGVAVGPLRYLVPTRPGNTELLERSCLAPECPNERWGNRVLTAFCGDHFGCDYVVDLSGVRGSGAPDAQAGRARVDALAEEAEERRRGGEGLARVAQALRV